MINADSVKRNIICFEGDSRTMLPVWERWFPHDICRVRGVSSTTTAQILARCATYPTIYADITMIECGVNDTVFDNNLDSTIANFKSIIDYYSIRSKKVLVFSSYPFNIQMYIDGPFGGFEWANYSDLNSFNLYVDAVSDAMELFSDAYDNVWFADLRPETNSGTELNATYTYDGVHGTDAMNILISSKIQLCVDTPEEKETQYWIDENNDHIIDENSDRIIFRR